MKHVKQLRLFENDTQDEILDEIKTLYVNCPECYYQDDDQYQCGTCDCGGGNGRINVYDYLEKYWKQELNSKKFGI